MAKNDIAKQRRIRRSRAKIHNLDAVFLSVHRTPRHIYAQVFSAGGKTVIAAASSLEDSFKKKSQEGGKIKIAEAVGKLVAERAKSKGITRIAFDRSGYKYHGRIKAVAEGARSNGLEF